MMGVDFDDADLSEFSYEELYNLLDKLIEVRVAIVVEMLKKKYER